MDWQPIETAPDTEEGILICDASKASPIVGQAKLIDGRWTGFNLAMHRGCYWPTPTHWMPLPPPPGKE